MSRRLNNRQSAPLFVQNHTVNLELTSNTAQKQANRRENETNIHQLVLSSAFFYSERTASALPIHLRSPHSGVFREGQNPENRLHTRHFVTRHPSPASQRQGAAHNWDTAAAAQNTSGGAEQQHCMHLHRIRSAVTPHFVLLF